MVYDPQKRIDELTMELNGSSSAAVSNLTLFSPSKVCQENWLIVSVVVVH